MRAWPAALLALAAAPLAAQPPAGPEERARQDREIVYFLEQPATHSFFLYHDYTESREGVGHYLNVVRQGSTAVNPSARVLDTGEPLVVETLKGEAVTRAGLSSDEPIAPDADVVVIRFPPPPKGGSVRLRISETYADPGRYRQEGEELVWQRTLGRPRNAVVLPPGWYLTVCSVPATVSETEDGRIRLDLVNPRLDELDVRIQARRRSPEPASRPARH